VAAVQGRLEPIDEKSTLAIQPSLLLHEIEEKQSRENQKGLTGRRVVRLFRELFPQHCLDFTNGIAESIEELAREGLAIESAIEESRVIGRVRRHEKIQTIDGMRRWIVEIDVETPQFAVSGKIVNRQTIAIRRDQHRFAQDVVRLERSEEVQRCVVRGLAIQDVAIERFGSRREIQRAIGPFDRDSGAPPFVGDDLDGLDWISKVFEQSEDIALPDARRADHAYTPRGA